MDAIVEALWARLFPSLTTAVREGEGRAAVIQIVSIYAPLSIAVIVTVSIGWGHTSHLAQLNGQRRHSDRYAFP
jgi:hypothetical protein